MKCETNKFGTVLSLNVKFIKNRWSAILYLNGKIIDKMACSNKKDIGFICREMLRWYDKMGGISDWAKAARYRQKEGPVGQVWYHTHFNCSIKK